MNQSREPNVRWLGPYEPEDRHADKTTLDHVIELRKRLAETERYLNNALDVVGSLRKEIDILKAAAKNG